MDDYKGGIFLFIIGNLLILSISVYYIVLISILISSNWFFYYDYAESDFHIMIFYFFFFISSSIVNLIFYMRCRYKKKKLNLKENIIISPFIRLIFLFSSIVFLSGLYFNNGDVDIYVYRDYAHLILFSNSIVFIGVYLIIKEKFYE